jgi:D-alanyl-D-alanine carboxypeptidase
MEGTKWILFGAAAIAVLILGLSQPKPFSEADLQDAFQTSLDRVVAKNADVHNAIMMVDSYDFSWKGAAGLSDPEAGVAIVPDDQLRTASSSKMMTATVLLKLYEAGLVSLDAPIADYLAADVVDGLHIYEGTDYSNVVTVRNLLQHTSGLADDWFDPRDEGRFLHMILVDDTDRLWDPVDLVAYIKDNLTPLFAPGEGISYSDVNYVLAGLIIESVTGQALHEALREQLFAPLGMEHSYMQFRESARPSLPGRGVSHVAYGDIDYSTFRSLSADWGGGGVITTTEDMTAFLRAFANDEIFADPATRDAMFDWISWMGPTVDYGLGVIRLQDSSMGVLWGHLGVGQAFMFYWPEGDVTMCGTLNQDEVQIGSILKKVTAAVTRFRESQ